MVRVDTTASAEALDVIGMTWYLNSEDGDPVPVVRITVEVSPLMAHRSSATERAMADEHQARLEVWG